MSSTPFTLTGNFTFEQSQRDDGFGGMQTVTVVAVSDLTVVINGQTLENGRGAFVFDASGVAGFISGTAQLDLLGFSAGGSIGVHFNNTGGAVDESVQVAAETFLIQFAIDEADLIAFFGAGLSIDIGGFVTIEGNVSFTDAGNDIEVFAANDALIFIGQGPLRLDGDSVDFNPAARGLIIRNAVVGLVKFGPNLFALFAEGQVETVGLTGVSISGVARVRFNNTGSEVDRAISVINAAGETESVLVRFLASDDPRQDQTQARSFDVLGATVEIAGQQLTGSFSFG